MPPKKAPPVKGAAAAVKKGPAAPVKTSSGAAKKTSGPVQKNTTPSNTKSAPQKQPEAKEQPQGPVWTAQDTAARTIQCLVRRFLARVKLQRLKRARVEYEETMERLEKEAFVAIVRMEQEKLRREQEKEEEERRKKLEEKKRVARMLEAAFEGDNDAITAVLREVEQQVDEEACVRGSEGEDSSWGQLKRQRRLLAMVECRDANQNTPLSEASAGGHTSTLSFLIEHGADVNTRGQFERTPLYRAAFAGNMAAAQVLLTQGADPRLYASDGLMPLHVAGSDQMKELLENWDLALTDQLLQSLAAEKERRRREERDTCDKQENKLQAEVERLKKAHQVCQKQLEKALVELNRRIYEHDKCVRKNQNKSEITLKAIGDAEEEVEGRQRQAEAAKQQWEQAKVRLREQMTANQAEQQRESLSLPWVESLPGEQIAVRELDDVLLRDVGNKVRHSSKWPLIIDLKGQAATFLRYRDTNYVVALSHVDMETEALRMALLGALRYGKPFVVDMMQVDMWDTVCERLDLIHPRLSQLLLLKQLHRDNNFKVMLRATDSKEYLETSFLDDKLDNFKFLLITKQSQPSDQLLDMFHCFRVHVPGADAFADID